LKSVRHVRSPFYHHGVRIKRIDHVAICVADVEAAKVVWERAFGLHAGAAEAVSSQQTDAMLIRVGEGETALELIAPMASGDATSGLQKFLAKRGPGLHHVAIEVEGIEEALALLKALGVRLIDETPRIGARGHKVAFVHPSATGGVLVELVDMGKTLGSHALAL
jgi:methylmalonyl-CoA/ethylmalonyl-CoA epimerase